MNALAWGFLVLALGASTASAKKIKDQQYFKEHGSWNVKHVFHKEETKRDLSTTRFQIVEFQEDGWSADNIATLRDLLEDNSMRNALASSGVHSGSGLLETDRNVIAFIQFLKMNGISTPPVP